jgi:hypothetical protein
MSLDFLMYQKVITKVRMRTLRLQSMHHIIPIHIHLRPRLHLTVTFTSRIMMYLLIPQGRCAFRRRRRKIPCEESRILSAHHTTSTLSDLLPTAAPLLVNPITVDSANRLDLFLFEPEVQLSVHNEYRQPPWQF